MAKTLGHLSGSAYKGKNPVAGVRFETKDRNLYIGLRDPSKESQACILLGKVNERVPANDHFDANTWLDVTFPHIIFITGRRGSGKSYDLGIIAEGLAAKSDTNFSVLRGKFCTVLFDLQSQFWTLGEKLNPEVENDREQLELVRKWNLDGTINDSILLTPKGVNQITQSEIEFTLSPSALLLEDWLSLLKIDRFDAMGQLLRLSLDEVRSSNPSFKISDVTQFLRNPQQDNEVAHFQQSTIDGLIWRILAVDELQFLRPGPSIGDQILKPNCTSVILLRELEDSVKSVIVAVTMRQIEREMSRYHQKIKLAARKKNASTDDSMPSRVWVLIDEAHLVCPSENKTSANKVIIDYVKRGRDAGLSLVLATQQPSALDSSAISQVDLTLLHRLTTDADISAALHRLPSPLPSNISIDGKDISDPRLLMRQLAPGECIVADGEATRAFMMKARPRICPHGGGEPLL